MGEGRLQSHWCSHHGSEGWYTLILWICVVLVFCEIAVLAGTLVYPPGLCGFAASC